MSDDAALAWKLAFGALVLVFCAVVMVVRKPAATAPVALPAPAAVTPLPLLEPKAVEAATAPGALQPAPLDVVEETPVRIEVSLFDAQPNRAAAPKPKASPPKPAVKRTRAASKPRPGATPRTTAPAKRVLSARPPASSKVRRPHYPFDPRERFRLGEQAFAPGR